MIEWQNAIVINIIQESSSVKRFFLTVEKTNHFIFIPGQFITLDLPIHEKKNKRFRSYSIASSADGGNVIELIISLHPLGLGTQYLFNEISVGDNLVFRGPQGVFVLPEIVVQPIIFICTGTGIAPFRSMLKKLYDEHHKLDTHLIYGCRKREHILYFNEMIELQQENRGFHYHISLSQPDIKEDGFNTGYVHPVYEKLLIDLDNPLIYLCGWKNMIDEAIERLLKAGIDKKNIRYELYG